MIDFVKALGLPAKRQEKPATREARLHRWRHNALRGSVIRREKLLMSWADAPSLTPLQRVAMASVIDELGSLARWLGHERRELDGRTVDVKAKVKGEIK